MLWQPGRRPRQAESQFFQGGKNERSRCRLAGDESEWQSPEAIQYSHFASGLGRVRSSAGLETQTVGLRTQGLESLRTLAQVEHRMAGSNMLTSKGNVIDKVLDCGREWTIVPVMRIGVKHFVYDIYHDNHRVIVVDILDRAFEIVEEQKAQERK
jgi:hypothetical protein